MVSPFFSPGNRDGRLSFLSGWIMVEGEWGNEYKSSGKYKTFEQMGGIAEAICMWKEVAIWAENFQELPWDLQNRTIGEFAPSPIPPHPSLHRDSFLRTFTSQNFVSAPGHNVNSLYIFARVY